LQSHNVLQLNQEGPAMFGEKSQQASRASDVETKVRQKRRG